MGTLALDHNRGWFLVFTADSGKVVFSTERPEGSGFNLKSFAIKAQLYTIHGNGKINTVIRGGNTIVFLRRAGLLYCLCSSSKNREKGIAPEALGMLLDELVRLCELLLGPSHDQIAKQMDGFGQGYAKRVFMAVRPIINSYMLDTVGDADGWKAAVPENPKLCRRSRFKSKCGPLGAYLVLRIREADEPPMLVYKSKKWKKLDTKDQKIFLTVLEGLGREVKKEGEKRAVVVYTSNEVEKNCLTVMNVAEEYDPGLVLIQCTRANSAPISEKMLTRVAKYSRPPPKFLGKNWPWQ